MSIDIQSILSEEISDEAAYELLSVFSQLTTAIESRYYVQAARYMKDCFPLELPKYLEDDEI